MAGPVEALERCLADLRFAAVQLAKVGQHDAAARLDEREERCRDALARATGCE